ncbi:hypothetical protein Tsubulata_014796 [Turnera subulata]|uniref:Wall-associated receptor kinase domain-containing protein n=1 Tax=Turnera subulata TaxID=218843 RepID=A0A9Q0JLT5_9ROSI|nr:hypothetical protein Tsubulata_014796 [Turnera subulata]
MSCASGKKKNTLAAITDDTTLLMSCKSTCRKERVTIQWDPDRFCEAQNCCTISVQPGLQVLNPSVKSLNKGRDDEEECKLAFLAEDEWLVSKIEDVRKVQGMEYVPMKLGWVSNFSQDKYQETMLGAAIPAI